MTDFTWEKMVDEFAAVAEDGRTFELRVFQEIVGNSDTTLRIETSNGYTCYRIDEEIYRIEELDLDVTRSRSTR